MVRTLAVVIAAACSGVTMITALEHAGHQFLTVLRRRLLTTVNSSISMVISVRFFLTLSRLPKHCFQPDLWTRMPLQLNIRPRTSDRTGRRNQGFASNANSICSKGFTDQA
jgi:hypothetical protein